MKFIRLTVTTILSLAALASAGLLVYVGLPGEGETYASTALKPWLLVAAGLAVVYFLVVSPLTSGVFGVKGRGMLSFFLQLVLVGLGLASLYLAYLEFDSHYKAERQEASTGSLVDYPEEVSGPERNLTTLTDQEKAELIEEFRTGMTASYFCRPYGAEYSDYYTEFKAAYLLYANAFLSPPSYMDERNENEIEIDDFEARLKSMYEQDRTQIFPDDYDTDQERAFYCTVIVKQVSDQLNAEWKVPKIVKGLLD